MNATAQAELTLVSVKIEWIDDYDADGSEHLGKWCNYQTPQSADEKLVYRGSLSVLDHHGIWRDGKGRIVSAPEVYEYSREYQYTFHGNGHEKIAYALDDHARMVDLNDGGWCYQGCIAKALITLPNGSTSVVKSMGLWGIESDCGADYKRELETDELFDLRKQLTDMGFELPDPLTPTDK